MARESFYNVSITERIMNQRVGLLLNKVIHFNIVNKFAAERVINLLVTSKNDCLILPFIDYPGPICKQILTRDFKSLTVCDHDGERRNLLKVSFGM